MNTFGTGRNERIDPGIIHNGHQKRVYNGSHGINPVLIEYAVEADASRRTRIGRHLGGLFDCAGFPDDHCPKQE